MYSFILQNATTLLFIVVAIALFFFGYRYRGKEEEKKELEAKLDQQESLNEAKDLIIDLERDKQKQLEEIHEHAKKDNASTFSKFANDLFRKIFKTKR